MRSIIAGVLVSLLTACADARTDARAVAPVDTMVVLAESIPRPNGINVSSIGSTVLLSPTHAVFSDNVENRLVLLGMGEALETRTVGREGAGPGEYRRAGRITGHSGSAWMHDFMLQHLLRIELVGDSVELTSVRMQPTPMTHRYGGSTGDSVAYYEVRTDARSSDVEGFVVDSFTLVRQHAQRTDTVASLRGSDVFVRRTVHGSGSSITQTSSESWVPLGLDDRWGFDHNGDVLVARGAGRNIVRYTMNGDSAVGPPIAFETRPPTAEELAARDSLGAPRVTATPLFAGQPFTGMDGRIYIAVTSGNEASYIRLSETLLPEAVLQLPMDWRLHAVTEAGMLVSEPSEFGRVLHFHVQDSARRALE